MIEVKKLIQARVPLWLYHYVHAVAEKYAIADSTVIGTFLCMGAIVGIGIAKGDLKERMEKTGISQLDAQALQQFELDEVVLHETISKIFFEARKAMEERNINTE